MPSEHVVVSGCPLSSDSDAAFSDLGFDPHIDRSLVVGRSYLARAGQPNYHRVCPTSRLVGSVQEPWGIVHQLSSIILGINESRTAVSLDARSPPLLRHVNILFSD
jgi:hypothetical protein